MKKFFLFKALLFLFAGLSMDAQSQSKGKVIIIEEYIDENGEKQTKRTEKEWDDADEMNRYLDLEMPGSFDIQEYLDDEGNTFIFPPSSGMDFPWGGELKPYLGVTMTDHDEGAQIKSVAPGSPADLAGLQVDDILISVDGIVSATPSDVVHAINEHDVDDVITIKYARDGKTHTTEAILEGKQGDQGSFFSFFNDDDIMKRFQDIQENFPDIQRFFQDMPSDGSMSWYSEDHNFPEGMRPRLGATVQNHEDTGVEIVQVSPGSLAQAAGLRAGDIIISYDQVDINSVSELQSHLAGQEWNEQVQISYLRDGNPQTTTLDYTKPEIPRPKNLKRL